MRLPPHVVFVAVAFAACASGAVVNQERDPVMIMVGNGTSMRYSQDVRVQTAALPAPPARLWRQLNVAFAAMGLPVTQRDTLSFAVAAQNAEFNGRFEEAPMSRVVDCGLTRVGGKRADSYRVWLSVASQLVAEGSGSTLRTIVVARAQDPTSSTSAVQCGTTGVLEQEIAKQLGAQ